jgi:regulator of sigma E protease
LISFIITIVKLLIILCIVATIHEFGHFIIAKLFKTGVDEFSIGFGPLIIQKKYKGTMYSLRWIPLGGYCAIEGEEGESNSQSSFTNKNVIQKLLILVAGVTFNAILAVIVFLAVAMSFNTYTTNITGLQENSILEQAGISVGDTIYSINGKRVRLQEDLVNQSFADSENDDVTIEYIHDGQKLTTNVENAITDIGYIGVAFKVNDDNTDVTNEINMVSSGSAALEAGLKAGDKIISINGEETNNSSDVISRIRKLPNQDVALKVQRNETVIDVTVVPISKRYFDLQILSTSEEKTTISLACISAVNNIKEIVGSYVDLFKGKVGIKDMSGIVGIGEVVSKTSSFIEFLNLLGIISLAVGVANLMPFPPLDGGKMVIVICEAIARKKLSPNVEAIISYIGFAFLIGLTIVVTFNDIVRII